MPRKTTTDWLKAIDLGIEYKKIYGKSQRWSRYKDYYRGDFPGHKDPYGNMTGLYFNLTYAMARTIVPNVYFRNPYLNISPRIGPLGGGEEKQGKEVFASIVESTLNWLMVEMNVKRAYKRAASDTFFCGRGMLKVGYDGAGRTAQRIIDLDLPANIEEELNRNDEKLTLDINAREGMPWLRRIAPETVIVPFGTEELMDAEWIDHIILKPTELVKRDPLYKNTRGMQGSHLLTSRIMESSMRTQFFNKLTQEHELTEIHEIRDRRRNEIIAIIFESKVHNNPIGHRVIRGPKDDPMQIEGLNYSSLCFNDDPDYFWCVPCAAHLEPQQLDINETLTQAMYHKRIALLKILYKKGALDDGELRKLLSGEVGVGVEVKGSGPMKDLILPMTTNIPADLVGWMEMTRMHMREIIGIGRQDTGEVSPGRKTATEVNIAHGAKELRMDEKRDAMADLIEDSMRKVLQVVFKMWTDEKVMQVVGVDGARYWVKFKPSDLKAEYDFKVDVESLTPQTKQVKRGQLIQLIQALGNNPSANINYLLRELLRSFEWIDAMKVLPEAQEGQMNLQQFQQQQGDLKKNPNMLAQRAKQNANLLNLG